MNALQKRLAAYTRKKYGVISVDAWTAMTPAEKSNLIYELWQFKGAAESLGAAWQVVRLLTSWGCTVEWMPALKEEARLEHAHYCVIDVSAAKLALQNDGVGYGHSLAESLCCAALRCVGLLALR